MTGHTGISQLRIQEAQGIADDVEREAAYRIALDAVNLGLVDDDENPVGSADAEVTVSDPDVEHAFDVTFTGEMLILGCSYELVGE